MIFYTICHYS